MIKRIRATFRAGALMPSDSLDLKDGDVMTLSTSYDADPGVQGSDIVEAATERATACSSLLQMFDEIHSSVPESAWDNLPKDGAKNYKHYLYGWPKVEAE